MTKLAYFPYELTLAKADQDKASGLTSPQLDKPETAGFNLPVTKSVLQHLQFLVESGISSLSDAQQTNLEGLFAKLESIQQLEQTKLVLRLSLPAAMLNLGKGQTEPHNPSANKNNSPSKREANYALAFVEPELYKRLWINYAHINHVELFLSHGDLSAWAEEPQWQELGKQATQQLADRAEYLLSALEADSESVSNTAATELTTPLVLWDLELPKVYCFSNLFSLVDIRKLLKIVQLKAYGRNGVQAQCDPAHLGRLMWLHSLGLSVMPLVVSDHKMARLLAEYAASDRKHYLTNQQVNEALGLAS